MFGLKEPIYLFSIIIGVINLVLSFFLKDVFIAGMNLIIYIGMTIYFFRIDTSRRKQLNGDAEGIVDIIFEIFTIAMICFLSIKYKRIIFNWEIIFFSIFIKKY